jgi:hypothetical protein
MTTTTKAAATTTTTTTDDDDDDDGGYGGRDGQHRMRKGRRHDNETIHNNKIGKRYLGWEEEVASRRKWKTAVGG